MSCECQSGERVLMVTVPEMGERYPELYDFSPGDSWEVLQDLDALQVKIGPNQPWKTAGDVVNFLRTILDEPRLNDLKGGWVPGCGSIKDRVAKMVSAKSLVEMAPLDASPLLDILTQRRIDTWFQPIFLRSMELWGYECLMRSRTADGKMIFPNDLIAWSKQESLLFMLDRVCRERHLENAGAARLPEHANILINFMPTAIYEPAFCLRTTMNAAERCGIDPKRIIFEVVESEEMKDREHLASILGYYHNHGFRVALDDVGAGYSGLMMLADLNPDLVKIDRALINKAPKSAMHKGICRSLITLAHDAGKLALAEGVETAQERDLMLELGADLFQGYLFAKPSPNVVTTPVALQTAKAA